MLKYPISMRFKPKILIITLSFVLLAIVPLVVFNVRAPVLIVAEQSFIELYGKKRLQKESFNTSVALFRAVKTVLVTDDVGDDVVPFAIAEVSVKPYCVLFPLRFTRSAQIYRELNPNIPVVVLEGRYSQNENPSERLLGANKSDFFIYKTDINDDFYRLGLVINYIKPVIAPKNDDSAQEIEKKGTIAVFINQNQSQIKDIFLRGLYDSGVLQETLFFSSFLQYSDMPDLSCVVLAGLGYEYLEKKTGVPVVSFSWIDPFLLPADVVMVVNDSPWVQAEQAVGMVQAGEKTGLIKSKFLILDEKKFDKGVFALLKKTGKNAKTGNE